MGPRPILRVFGPPLLCGVNFDLMAFSLSNLRREVDWNLKRVLGFSRGIKKKKLGDPTKLKTLFSEEQRQRFEALEQTYDLSVWSDLCSEKELRYNLYYLDICDRYLADEQASGPSLDIGSRNWYYIPALMSFCPGSWDGVEVDGNQRYLNMATRRTYAEHMSRLFAEARYRVCSVLDIHDRYRFITWFLPYVSRRPMIHSGLPDRFFQPESLLKHTYEILEPGGLLFIVNPDLEEADLQKKLLQDQELPFESIGELYSDFPTDEVDVCFGFVVRKPAANPNGTADPT